MFNLCANIGGVNYETARYFFQGFSGLGLSVFLECQKKFYYSFIEKLREKKIGSALWYGSLIHEATLIWGLQNHEPEDVIMKKLSGSIDANYKNPQKGDILLELEENQQQITDTACEMTRLFLREEITPTEIENSYAADLIHPKTGEKTENVIIKAKIDFLETATVEESLSDNQLTILKKDKYGDSEILVDLKTAGCRINNLNGYFLQLAFNALVALLARKKPVKYAGIYALIKTRKPLLQSFYHKISMEELVAVHDLVKDCAERIMQNKFTSNFNSCLSKFKKPCPFLSLCHKSLYQVPEIELSQNLITEDIL